MKKDSYICHFCDGKLTLTGDNCHDKPAKLIGCCDNCNLVQVVDFSHVNEEFYASEDWKFCNSMDSERKRQREWNRNRVNKIEGLIPEVASRKVLDFGCGTGGFLEQAQGIFGDIIGFDLNKKVCSSHAASGWKCVNSMELIPADIEVITLFHVLEHVPEPWKLLQDLQSRFVKAETFVIEVPNTDEVLNTVFKNDSYQRNHYSSEHIWYFTSDTLRQVVERGGLGVAEDTQLQRYTLANTMGWLSMNKGGTQDTWDFFDERKLNELYENVLVSRKIADSVFFICNRGDKVANEVN